MKQNPESNQLKEQIENTEVTRNNNKSQTYRNRRFQVSQSHRTTSNRSNEIPTKVHSFNPLFQLHGGLREVDLESPTLFHPVLLTAIAVVILLVKSVVTIVWLVRQEDHAFNRGECHISYLIFSNILLTLSFICATS
jgi:hypothetical protein